MPFFIPRDLIRLNYFAQSGNDEKEKARDKETARYSGTQSLAFFLVNLGLSKSEYLELTPTERAFCLKAWEEKEVREHELMRNDMLNALANAFRAKGKKFVDLFPKAPQKVDREEVKRDIESALESEKNDGDWISRIYRANGMSKPEKGG